MWPDFKTGDGEFDRYAWEEMRAEIRQILMSKWDPIGVSDEPKAADEYDSYINGTIRLLMNEARFDQLEEYLRDIEIERMGLTDLKGKPFLPGEVRSAAVLALLELRTRRNPVK